MPRFSRTLASAVASALCCLPALAHPVAEGHMELSLEGASLVLKAEVSTEQAFVAEAYGKKGAPSASLDLLYANHGDYMLQHLAVRINGSLAAGRVAKVDAPAGFGDSGTILYTLTYAIPPGAMRPLAVELSQNVLNEFEFAPGNRWEASYRLRAMPGERSEAAPLLFTSAAPLTLSLQ